MLELELVAGQNFEKDAAALNRTKVILNEKALDLFGFESAIDAIGQTLYVYEGDTATVNIAGVVKGYNYQFIFVGIEPLMIVHEPTAYQYTQVKISGFDLTEEMVAIDKVLDAFDPNHELEAQTFQGQK